jgi:hypothetical protein
MTPTQKGERGRESTYRNSSRTAVRMKGGTPSCVYSTDSVLIADMGKRVRARLNLRHHVYQ